MKKLILSLCLFNLLISPSFADNNENNNQNTIMVNGKNYPLEDFTGEYSLLDYKVYIKLKENNKLFLIFKDLPLKKDFKQLFPMFFDEKFKKNEEEKNNNAIYLLNSITFPYNDEYELVPIGGLSFILRSSGGYSIEFKYPTEKIKSVIFRDQNASILDKEKFIQIIDKKEYYTLLNKKNNKNINDKPSVKDNMHKFQLQVETFSVDNNGIYSKNVKLLSTEANKKGYWKEIINPYTQKTGENLAYIDYTKFKSYKPSPALKGLVIYEILNCKYDYELKMNGCFSYKIYGTDENGNLLKDKNQKDIFYLSNE